MHRHSTPRIAVVLGGGGLKGFAHIGVLRALAERGITPALLAGTSIGSLIAAAYATGMSLDTMSERAAALRRRDLFRLNHLRMLIDRTRVGSIYLEAPLRALVRYAVPHVRFDELAYPVLVNTVDVTHGTQVVWGLRGLRDVYLDEAVYASCALPGFFPPGRVGGKLCIDGGTIDNLPVAPAALGMDAVIAVDVGNSDLTPATAIGGAGFGSIYMRAATIMMHALQLQPLAQWSGPPMLLIRPKISHIGWMSFARTDEAIAEGYRAATEALEHLDECLAAPGGIYPRRTVNLAVNRAACIGCGLCAALAPGLMGLDSEGKAFARTTTVQWSPADGDFVNQCPTNAIEAGTVVPLLRSA